MNNDRSKFIGGSDIAAIMGMSRWTSPLKLFYKKTGKLKEDLSGLEYIEIGTDIEEFIAQRFQKKTGLKVRRAPKQYIHKEHSFLAAQLDRLIEGTDMLLECKNSSEYKLKEWDDGEVPQEYLLQVMWYLGITGRAKGYIAVLIGGNKFRHKEIVFDKELFDLMVEKAVSFWNDFVLKDVPPMATSGDADLLKELFPKAQENKAVTLDNNINELINKNIELKHQLKLIKTAIDDTENKIKFELKEAETGETDKFFVKWANINTKRVDNNLLKEAGIYEQYCKESSYRKFSIKERKV